MILSEAIYKAAKALGADLSSQIEPGEDLTNAPEFVREYYRHFTWPPDQVFTGKDLSYGEDIPSITLYGWRIRTVGDFELPDDFNDDIEMGNYYSFGATYGGNCALVLSEFDTNPSNPMVSSLDHEPDSEPSELCSLLELFTSLVPLDDEPE